MTPEAPAPPNADSPATPNRSRVALVVPFILGLLVIGGMTAATATLTPTGANSVANFMFSVFCLFPAIICLFAGYLLVVAAMYGLHQMNTIAAAQIKKADETADKLAQKVTQTADNLNQRAAQTSIFLAQFNPVFEVFERHQPAPTPETDTPSQDPDQSQGGNP